MPQWTKDQQRVIGSSSGRLICSAAAGSGKTTVMIERIVRLIREGDLAGLEALLETLQRSLQRRRGQILFLFW